jgi:DNA-binding response OmpR family regulator
VAQFALWLSVQTTDHGSVKKYRQLVEQTVTINLEQRSVILVVEDVEETRQGIERLLAASGYQVIAARDEEEAVQKACLQPPDLILISLGLDAVQNLSVARRMRERAGLGERVPVVVFCVEDLNEGAEVGVGYNVYMTRPDNFDQLRALLNRLLRKLHWPG